MPIKNIIFDFGGVLVNDRSDDTLLKEIIQKLPEEHQLKNRELLTQSELGLIPYEDVWKFDEEILFPNKSREEIEDFFLNTEVYNTFFLAEKLLSAYKVIIFSDNHKGAPEKMAKNLNINISQFPFINSAFVGMRKPNIEFYKYLIKLHNLIPEESVFIDNTQKNLTPARQLGIRTFHYTKNYDELIEYLKALGVA